MKHLRELRDNLKFQRHPGAHMIDAILKTSNSLDFIKAMCCAIQEAVKKDIEEEERRISALLSLQGAWVEWDSTGTPPNGDLFIEVRLADGLTLKAFGREFSWDLNDDKAKIVAYRILATPLIP